MDIEAESQKAKKHMHMEKGQKMITMAPPPFGITIAPQSTSEENGKRTNRLERVKVMNVTSFKASFQLSKGPVCIKKN